MRQSEGIDIVGTKKNHSADHTATDFIVGMDGPKTEEYKEEDAQD